MKELRLRDIQTVEEANELLAGGFIDLLNQKFAQVPLSPHDAHAPLCGIKLEQVLVWTYSRQLQNDWTIDFQGERYQILDSTQQLRAKQKVEVRIHFDGQMSVYANGTHFNYQPIEKPKRVVVPKRKETDYVQKRLAGRKGKKASPWGQFNPHWLKRKRTGSLSVQI